MKLFRSRIFTPTGNPFQESAPCLALDDGFLAVEDGRIAAVGDWRARPEGSSIEIVELGPDTIIVPGFVDLHLHAPQLEMIGSYGGHLLEWLQKYTFPNEAKFRDPGHARRVSARFFDELLRHGTLTALVFSTIHKDATEALFEEAERRRFRAILGKTMMDRNAPTELLEDPRTALEESRTLIRKWHGRGRLGYAITPRFAPTSTPELLAAAQALRREFPDVWVHTHVSENVAEIRWVADLFPEAAGYLDVYDRFGLLGERTILAHGVHLSDPELDRIAETQTRLAHCPNSNLFLGSGLFPMQRVLERGVSFGLGTDIGAGTTLSMFAVMSDAYKIQQVRGLVLSPLKLWYLATLGGACALGLEKETGSLEVGKAADFLVLDLGATPLLSARAASAQTTDELLAALVFLADDRAVAEARIGGEIAWR
ncbi:MAG TPA: guanine deaminase, partial [Thermoanaerobaculia bacterium]|nr:guanine deaminase [Thermoanaerobaculia bacterium]